MTLEIESWRWQGVPFYIRAGKSMATTITEAVVEFRQPPRMLFADADDCPEPNRLRFRMKPDDRMPARTAWKRLGVSSSRSSSLRTAYCRTHQGRGVLSKPTKWRQCPTVLSANER